MQNTSDLATGYDICGGMPLCAFNSRLSGLESIVTYLKDIEHMRYKDIAMLLRRKQSTIYTTYARSKVKLERYPENTSRLNTDMPDSHISSMIIPYHIFSNRRLSVLESLIHHLKSRNLTPEQISKIIGRKESTIRTICWRYSHKQMK